MTVLVVTSCGPMTSLQDAGRLGWQRFGVSTSGAMDRPALAAANALVGNAPGAAAIEFMLLGGSFRIEGGTVRLAMAGAPCAATVEGRLVPPFSSVLLRSGETFSVKPAQAGVYAYLAVAGGFDLPLQLGSLSLHPRARIGGIEGRPLQAGDRLPLRLRDASDGPEFALDPQMPELALEASTPVRVVLGPQDDHFTPEGVATFLSTEYRVSREADRMGYRLSGPAIPHASGFNIVSDGIVTGAVQVPGSGEPIVMMADRQTTGGYPKIATVISADVRLVAQRRPGEAVRFEAVSMQVAQAIARSRVGWLAGLPIRLRPLGRSVPSTEELLGLNLAGAAVDALAEA